MRRLTYCLFYLERRDTQHLILKNATSCYSCCCHNHYITAVSSWSSYFYSLFVSVTKLQRIRYKSWSRRWCRQSFSTVSLCRYRTQCSRCRYRAQCGLCRYRAKSEDSRRGLDHFIYFETALFKASTNGALCDGPLRLHEVLGFAKYHRCYCTRGKVVLLTVVRKVRPPLYPVSCCAILSVWFCGQLLCSSVDSSSTVLWTAPLQFCGQLLCSSDRSHPVVLVNIHKVFYSVTTQHQYIVNNT
jgi:hypothetical protein